MRTRRAVVLAALLVSVLMVAPAQAAPAAPGAPYVVASTPHSITLTWASRAGADRYRVSFARTPAKATRTSAATRSTRKRAASLTVRGLAAGKTYCFAVRVMSARKVGRASAVHCHSTMGRRNRTSQPTASVVTFNICGATPGCGSWAKRRRAVLQRIDDSRADVVALQESGYKRKELGPDLKARGFVRADYDKDQVIFYRTSRFSIGTYPRPYPVCRDQPLDPGVNTKVWDRPTFQAATGEYYVYVNGSWFVTRKGCPIEDVPISHRGAGWLTRDTPFTYAALRDRQTGKQILVIDTHLTAGRTKKAARVRATETRSLIRQARSLAKGRPVVIAGDVNSDLTRPDDTVGKLLTRSGYRDTYQRSATYVRPNVNSFNGYHRTPRRNTRWGGHIDRIFTLGSFGVTKWEVVARMKHGRYAGTFASDHNPVRVTLYLP